jgi:carbon monoxide dehydrogenase subunit G
MTYDRTVQIAAPPKTVFAVTADHASWGSYGMKYLVDVKVDQPEDEQGWTQSTWHVQLGARWKFSVRARHDLEHLTIHAQAISGNGFFKSAEWNYQFLPSGEHTLMVVHFEWELGAGQLMAQMFEPLARVMWNDQVKVLAWVSEERARAARSS